MEISASAATTADGLTNGEARARRIARAVIFALVLAVGLAGYIGAGIGDRADTAAPIDTEAPRLGGDFPAFYGAGSIILDGDLDVLYEEDRQIEAQLGLGLDGYLAFAYPPHVAVAYAPLAALPFQVSYLAHTALMAGAYIAALAVLSPVVPLIARWRLPLIAVGFTFYPLAVAIGGGQNAALTVLGFAIIWRALHDDREVVAGVTAGLMMYRPQYALAAIGLMFLSRHWKAVAAAIATTAATWLGTALVLGTTWLTDWFDAVLPFVERDAEVNAPNSISALGFMQAALGVDSPVALVVGLVVAGSVTITLMYLWSRPQAFALGDRMAALAIGSVIISPHANFYDAAVLVIAGAAVLARSDRTNPPFKLLAIGWVAFLPIPLLDDLPATHLAIFMLVAFVVMITATLHWSNAPMTARDLFETADERKVEAHA